VTALTYLIGTDIGTLGTKTVVVDADGHIEGSSFLEYGVITPKQGWAEQYIGEEADLVCANIHLQIVETLFSKKGFFTKRWIILSGIFVRDAEEIERRLKENSIEIFQRFREKTWITWIGVNRSCKGS